MKQNTEKKRKITFKKVLGLAAFSAGVVGVIYLSTSEQGRKKCKDIWSNIKKKEVASVNTSTPEPKVGVQAPSNENNKYPNNNHGYGYNNQKRPYWQQNKKQ